MRGHSLGHMAERVLDGDHDDGIDDEEQRVELHPVRLGIESQRHGALVLGVDHHGQSHRHVHERKGQPRDRVRLRDSRLGRGFGGLVPRLGLSTIRFSPPEAPEQDDGDESRTGRREPEEQVEVLTSDQPHDSGRDDAADVDEDPVEREPGDPVRSVRGRRDER